MAFVEVRLPDDVEKGAVGGPMFDTTVFKLSSGFEQRNINWSLTRGEWDIGYGIQSKANFDLVKEFFYTRQGRAHGFRFKDWTDFEIGDILNPTTDNQRIGLGDDTTTVFQIFKRYSSGGVDFDRTIKKLVSGNVVVLLDDVVQGSGFTIQLNAGTITFSVAPASTGGSGPGGEESVEVAVEFDVPVRFDTDHFRISAETFDAGAIPDLKIIELRIV